MHHAPEAHTLSTLQRTAWRSDAIEWEELPSLADSLAQRLIVLGERHRSLAGDGAAAMRDWVVTQAAELDAPPPSGPFHEALEGLAIREVNEPEVFRHFFGSTGAR